MKCLKMRGQVDIWVDDEIATKIQDILVDSQASQFIEFGGRTINTADVRGIFTEEDMGQKKERPLLLGGGMDMSIAPGLSNSERKRKMKIMAQAYFDARNEVRAEAGKPLLTITDLPRNIQAYLTDTPPQALPVPPESSVKPPHVPGFFTPGEILTPAGVRTYRELPF